MNIKRILVFGFMQLIIINCIACCRIIKDNSTVETHHMVSSENAQLVGDDFINLELICKYQTGESAFFMKANEYPTSIFLYKDELYLLNYTSTNLIIINTRKKTTTTNTVINNIIKTNSNKYFGVQKILVTDKYLFIGFLRAVICLTKDGLIIGKVDSDDNINHFTVDDNSIVVFTSDNINRFDFQGRKLAFCKLENTLTGHFINYDKDVYAADGDLISTYNIGKFEINKGLSRFTVPLSNIPFKEPYLAYVTSKYTVWYPYMTRDQILLLDRNTNKPLGTVKFNKADFAPTNKEIELEEGKPNFNVIMDDTGVIYIILMKNKILEVYRAL